MNSGSRGHGLYARAAEGQGATDRPGPIPRKAAGGGLRAKAWRAICAMWKLGFGALCGMSFLGSFLVVGWAQRAARREVVKSWWKRSAVRRNGVGFAEFAEADGRTAGLAHWPDWFLGGPEAAPFAGDRAAAAEGSPVPGSDHGAVASPSPSRSRIRRWSGSFGLNLKLGIQAAFNTSVVLLPGGLLWAFAWYAGWQNSFNKGYENAVIGPSTFALGVLLFAGAMFYLPMAQARQASTGDWREFYRFKLVWKVARRGWIAAFALAVLALVLAFPMGVFRALPLGFPGMDASLLDLSSTGQLRWIRRYYLLTALYGVPAFVLFRLMAARVYAGAICGAVQSGAISEEDLADGEWETLHRLALLRPPPTPAPARPLLVKVLAWLATRTGRITSAVATFVVWLLFVFNLMTTEFLHFHVGGRGWWNQPLLQLPWFDYTPKQLKEAAKAEKDGSVVRRPRPGAEGR